MTVEPEHALLFSKVKSTNLSRKYMNILISLSFAHYSYATASNARWLSINLI